MSNRRTFLTEVVIYQKDLYGQSLLSAVSIEMLRTHEGWKDIVYDTDDIHIMPIALHDKLMVSVEFDCSEICPPDDDS